VLTKRGKYAIRAVLFLARRREKGSILIQDIAEQESIPKKFLEAILLDLKNEGVLSSRKGKGGGYSLEQSPDTLTVGRIVRIIDGPLAPVRCVSQTAYAACDDCPDERTCMIRYVMKEVRENIASVMDNTSVLMLLEKEASLQPLGTSLSFDI
jgi:Rrf2 family protein